MERNELRRIDCIGNVTYIICAKRCTIPQSRLFGWWATEIQRLSGDGYLTDIYPRGVSPYAPSADEALDFSERYLRMIADHLLTEASDGAE